ncbi:hypothetical protein AB4918_09960 [Bifidobacterium dentium]|uniref:hypothetical protein n=2 Tax=Bifidobacterium TaxID=1678 RepID=UPI0027B93472|nr:hypothetical protein [Bifidobacterium dentium]
MMVPLAHADSSAADTMYRLYNRHSGEHFYTGSANERDGLRRAGWRWEGAGWVAPLHLVPRCIVYTILT